MSHPKAIELPRKFRRLLRPHHVPVMLEEVIEFLRPSPGAIMVDATVGAGGHAAAIAERILPDGRLIGVDRDLSALTIAAETLAPFKNIVNLVHSCYDNLEQAMSKIGIEKVDGILLDLGVSSIQLDNAERGFSFSQSGPLDMRMDQSIGITAAEWIARSSEDDLAQIFFQYGEERWSRRIARRIVEEREKRSITTTRQLAEMTAGAVPRGAWPKGIHPATRVFQALRIVVNEELSQIEPAIRQGVQQLKMGGRMVVIAFHSLEDRIVKQTFALLGGACTCPPGFPICVCGAKAYVRLLTRKVIVPKMEEIERNPRARSARLRVVERLP